MPRLTRHVRRFHEATEVVATVDIGTLWARMLTEFTNESERLGRAGVEGDELQRQLEAFLDGLSSKPLEEMASTSANIAYSEGRSSEIQGAADRGEAEYVVYSSVLDAKTTCDPCRNLDGQTFEVGSADYFAFGPPAKCEGRDRCWCQLIPIRRAA